MKGSGIGKKIGNAQVRSHHLDCVISRKFTKQHKLGCFDPHRKAPVLWTTFHFMCVEISPSRKSRKTSHSDSKPGIIWKIPKSMSARQLSPAAPTQALCCRPCPLTNPPQTSCSTLSPLTLPRWDNLFPNPGLHSDNRARNRSLPHNNHTNFGWFVGTGYIIPKVLILLHQPNRYLKNFPIILTMRQSCWQTLIVLPNWADAMSPLLTNLFVISRVFQIYSPLNRSNPLIRVESWRLLDSTNSFLSSIKNEPKSNPLIIPSVVLGNREISPLINKTKADFWGHPMFVQQFFHYCSFRCTLCFVFILQ